MTSLATDLFQALLRAKPSWIQMSPLASLGSSRWVFSYPSGQHATVELFPPLSRTTESGTENTSEIPVTVVTGSSEQINFCEIEGFFPEEPPLQPPRSP